MHSRYGPFDLFRSSTRRCVVRAACASFAANLLFWGLAVEAGATELNASYSNFDAAGFMEGHADIAPDIDEFARLADALRAREVSAERAARHREAVAIAELLADGARRFEELHRRQVAEMASEVERARRDKDIRQIRQVLNLGAAVLGFAANLEQWSSSTSDTGSGAGELGPDAPDGSRSLEQRFEETIKVRINGEWRTINTKEMFRRMIKLPPAEGGAQAPSAGAPESSFGELADRFGELAADLPPIVCDDSFRGCFPVDGAASGPAASGDGSAETPPPTLPASISPPRRNPTSEETGLWKTLSSLALDALPGVGTAKGGLELVTGKDSVTGESIPRVVSAGGLGLSVVPGGKLLAKTGGKAAIEYGSTVFRHYTSRGGLGRIYKTGVIKADNEGRVFAVLANGRPLRRRDAVRRLGLDDEGKAQDFIEFRLPVGTPIRKNPISPGLSEFVIKGDVHLAPGSGAKFTQRRWNE